MNALYPTFPKSFLPHEDLPPNLLRVKVGEKVRLLQDRQVARVGYRISLREARDAVASAWTREADAKLVELCAELGFKVNARTAFTAAQDRRVVSAPFNATNALLKALGLMYLDVNGYGGEDRGVEVTHWTGFSGKPWTVTGKRTVYVGKRYEGSGGGYNAWTGDYYDYEPAGLHPRRAIVLLTLDCGFEVLSGDCERVKEEEP